MILLLSYQADFQTKCFQVGTTGRYPLIATEFQFVGLAGHFHAMLTEVGTQMANQKGRLLEGSSRILETYTNS